MGEYAVRAANGEWIEFRVPEERARKTYLKTEGAALYRVEGRDLRMTLLESR